MKATKSKVVIFSIAVAFISVFFFAYAIQAVYPAPKYEDFCGERAVRPVAINNAGDCEAKGGQWTDYGDMAEDGQVRTLTGWCDEDYVCRGNYERSRKLYERNVFFANLIIGIILLVVAFFLGLEAVSSGLMGGAVMLIIYGSIRYWGELSDVWRTVMLGIALSVLVWLGYKKLKD